MNSQQLQVQPTEQLLPLSEVLLLLFFISTSKNFKREFVKFTAFQTLTVKVCDFAFQKVVHLNARAPFICCEEKGKGKKEGGQCLYNRRKRLRRKGEEEGGDRFARLPNTHTDRSVCC